MIENLQGPLGDIILFQRFEWLRIFKDHLVTLFYSKDLNDRESSRTTWWHYSIPKIWMIENLQGPLGDIILFQRFEWLRIFKDHLVTLFYKDLNDRESSRTTWWHYSIPKIWMIENLQGPLGDIILFQRFEWSRIFKDHLVTLFYSKDLNDWESSRTTWWHYSIPNLNDENLQGPLVTLFYQIFECPWRTTSDIILFQRSWMIMRIFKDHHWWHYSIPKIFEWIENLQGPLGDIIHHSKDLNDRESSKTKHWWH